MLKILLYFIPVILFFSHPVHSQLHCGTGSPPPTTGLRTLAADDPYDNPGTVDLRAPSRAVAMTVHILQMDDGTGGYSLENVEHQINLLNSYMDSANLYIYVESINYINNTEYFNLSKNEEGRMARTHDVANTINLYICKSLSDWDGSYMSGYAYYPGGPDRIFMTHATTINRLLVHEVGHYFGLSHTHEGTADETNPELVDGSNCESAGDRICDTPADPNRGWISSCEYRGTGTDANGQSYDPDPHNIMSYSYFTCKIAMSPNQYAVMSTVYEQSRTYLRNLAPEADFRATSNYICTDAEVEFTDQSTNAVTWHWQFPGGTPSTSAEQHPTVVYENEGIYDVELIVTNELGYRDTLTRENYITTVGQLTSESVTSSFEEPILRERIINDDDITFRVIRYAETAGEQSIQVHYFDYKGSEQKQDYLILLPLKTDVEKDFTFTFDYAYTYTDEDHYETLEIVYRAACSSGEWVSIWKKEKEELATVPPMSTFFYAQNDNEWGSVELNIEFPDSLDNVEVAFRTTTRGNGNNLFLDNYLLEPITSTFQFDYTTTNVSCHDGSDGVIKILTDAPEDYTYGLDSNIYQSEPEFTGLKAGTYQVYVMNQEHQVRSRTVTLTEPEVLDLTTEVVNTCPGASQGQITVLATGGTGALAFSLDESSPQESDVFEELSAGEYSVTVHDANGCTGQQTVQVEDYPAIQVEYNLKPPSCASIETGTIEVIVSGEPGEFAYSIDGGSLQSSNVFGGLASGEYTITTQDDNGCSVSDTVSLPQPDSILLSAVEVVNTCGETSLGQITIVASGGTGTLTYSLGDGSPQESNVFQGLSAGEYTVIAHDENECTSQQTVQLEEYPALKVEYSLTPSACGHETGTIEVIASGGSGDFSYAIDSGSFQASNIFNGLASGQYEITTQDDNGCLLSNVVSLDDVIMVNTDVAGETCAGEADGSVRFEVFGGSPPYRYFMDGEEIQSDVQGLASGAYAATITDSAGCEKDLTIVVEKGTEYPEKPVIIYDEESHILSIETAAENVQWYLNGDTIAGAVFLSFEVTKPGAYTVGLANDACSVLSDTYVIEEAGVLAASDRDHNQVKIYPNPAQGVFSIEIPEAILKRTRYIRIGDISGKDVFQIPAEQRRVTQELAPGVYMISGIGNEVIWTRRLIVE